MFSRHLLWPRTDIPALSPLHCLGEKKGLSRSIEQAFSTGGVNGDDNENRDLPTGENERAHLLEALQTFAAGVGGEDGLSVQRLVRLTTGLARCADGEAREAAERCQVTDRSCACFCQDGTFCRDVAPPCLTPKDLTQISLSPRLMPFHLARKAFSLSFMPDACLEPPTSRRVETLKARVRNVRQEENKKRTMLCPTFVVLIRRAPEPMPPSLNAFCTLSALDPSSYAIGLRAGLGHPGSPRQASIRKGSRQPTTCLR